MELSLLSNRGLLVRNKRFIARVRAPTRVAPIKGF